LTLKSVSLDILSAQNFSILIGHNLILLCLVISLNLLALLSRVFDILRILLLALFAFNILLLKGLNF